jgi:RNA polymerase sigma-70 factor (ECF subfamily)
MWRALSALSFKEIGALYGKSENWACVTYHRARRHIKKRMEETET